METFDVSDELMFRIHGAIERSGFFIMFVLSTRTSPSWAYTIGLLERDHPELVTIGLSSDSSYAFLSRAYQEVVAGVALEPGPAHRRTWDWNVDVDLDVAFLELPDLQWLPPSNLVLGVHGYYGARGHGYPSEPRVCQLVWPDFEGRLPWDAGFDKSRRTYQPLLDEVLWDPTPDEHATCGPGCDLWGRNAER